MAKGPKAKKEKPIGSVFLGGEKIEFYLREGKVVYKDGQPAPAAIATALMEGQKLESPEEPVVEEPARPPKEKKKAPLKQATERVQQEAEPAPQATQEQAAPGVGSKLGSIAKGAGSRLGMVAKGVGTGLAGTVIGGTIRSLGLDSILSSGLLMNALFSKGEKSEDTGSSQRLLKAAEKVSPIRKGVPETTTKPSKEDVSVFAKSKLSDVEFQRELTQQNDEIIRLLEAILNTLGGEAKKAKGAAGEGGLFDKIKNLLMGIPGIGAAIKGGSVLLKGASALGKGAIAGAKFLGRGVAAGAGLARRGVKALFTGGDDVAKIMAREGGEIAAKQTAKAEGSLATKALAEGGETAAEAAAKTAGKAAATETAETAAKKGGKVAIKEIVAKIVGPRVAKTVAKSIPFVGALAGLGFGISRALEGDYKGAAAEVGGGAASIFPGVGTAVSLATDVGLLARDVYKAAYNVFPEDDPLASERMGEIQKEVTDYINAQVTGTPSAPTPTAAPTEPSTVAAAASSGPSASPQVAPTSGGETGLIPASNLNVTPSASMSPLVMSAQSTQQALQTATAASTPVVINNAPSVMQQSTNNRQEARRGGAASTSPMQSHIDRALYGNVYGAGVP